MKKRISIRYMVELFITLLLMLFIAVVLVQMFVFARGKSVHASQLSDAVLLSENIAEVLSGAGGEDAEALAKMQGVSDVQEADGQLRITWQEEPYLAVIAPSDEEEVQGLACRDITIYETGSQQELYRLRTGFRTGGSK